MPGDRPHDVAGLTVAELEQTRRDLEVSLALAFPGSPVRVPILARLSAVDAALAEHQDTASATGPMIVYLCSCGFATDDPGWLDGHLDEHPGHHQRRTVRDSPASGRVPPFMGGGDGRGGTRTCTT